MTNEMKVVNLIKLESNRIEVGDFRNLMEVRTPTAIINSSEFTYERPECENIKIEKVVDHGVEHYIAAERKVWEYLLLIKNPLTVKSLLSEKERLNNRACELRYLADKNEHELLMLRNSIKNAGLLTRIKWVFTGVKNEDI